MSSIINNLQNENNVPSSSGLVEGFTTKFKNIFSYNYICIKVVGTVEKPWYRDKDILKILGYNENNENCNKILQKIDLRFKSDLSEVRNETYLIYNECKEKKINETGL